MDGIGMGSNKHMKLSIDHIDTLCKVAHALSSPVRARILRQLGDRSMSVNELSVALDIPMSTTALAVTILEEAGVIKTEGQPGTRGMMKVCSRRLNSLMIAFVPVEKHGESVLTLHMPIGGYSVAREIKATCGIIDEHATIGEMDNPSVFYLPGRFAAQLIWFKQGFLEYRFSTLLDLQVAEIDWLELSFEACSEAPMYRDPWKSDIAVDINEKRLGTWTCPGDFGGRRGRLNPSWWSDVSTQYGLLKTWRVNKKGSYLEGEYISGVTIDDLNLATHGHISVQIGIDEGAEHVGGINLFGEHFGDYEQGLVLRIGYHSREI